MPQGVHFPSNNTTATARSIVAKALHAVDPVKSLEAADEMDWRLRFGEFFRYMVQAGLDSPETARSIANAGLAATYEQMRFNDQALEHVVADPRPSFEFGTQEVRGEGKPQREITVPFRGRSLQGKQLLEQLRVWREQGQITATCETAVAEVLDHPDWLQLEGDTIVLLGALAEVGPLRQLMLWGADVVAIDRPTQLASRQLSGMAAAGSGRVRFPARPQSEPDGAEIGAHIKDELPEIAHWLSSMTERLTLGHYYYADGASHVQLSAGADAISRIVTENKPDTGLAYLASPTAAYAVGAHEIDLSTRAYEHERTWWRAPARMVSGGRLLNPNYPDDAAFGICNSIIPTQGPYYALAKQIQRWRASMAVAEGRQISINVAPLTYTRSLTSSKTLMAACAGAARFGIDVLEPETSQALMALMLVHDMRAQRRRHREPWREELHGAAHSGVWTCAYSATSVLRIAAMAGFSAGPNQR